MSNDLLVSNQMLRETAEKAGVCIRPLLRRVVDTETGEDRVIAMPCGSTRERVCKPCADKARRVRMHQCREGWHRTDEFPHDPDDESPVTVEPDEVTDDQDLGDDEDQGETRKRRTTRRREDAPPLPAVEMDKYRTVAAALTSPNGNTYRPSMFLTVTLPSYGRVNSDGTPKHPNRYDYRRAALDAIHFASAVDRLFQNLRRCAGFNAQYFATVEPQQRLALHLHAAVRGVVTRQVFQQIVAATYHQVWWPKHDEPVYTLTNLPSWSETAGGYVDPVTGEPLRTWDQAMAQLDHPDAEPAHVVWFGKQTDHQWFIAGSPRSDRRIGYLTKYLTKSIAEAIDPDTATARQREHADRLARETRWLPCSTKCANWLRFGIQPQDSQPGLMPGECDGKAHQPENLGHGGRRVLVSRKWSGKRLAEHRADRAEVVRQALEAAGMDMPAQDRCSATQTRDDGRPRYVWEPVDLRGDGDDPDTWREVIRASIRERLRWQADYQAAKLRAGPHNRSATQPPTVATTAA